MAVATMAVVIVVATMAVVIVVVTMAVAIVVVTFTTQEVGITGVGMVDLLGILTMDIGGAVSGALLP